MGAAYHLPTLLAGAALCTLVLAQAFRALLADRKRIRQRRQSLIADREAFRQRVQAIAAQASVRSGRPLAWQGLRDFRVSAIVDECVGVKSFYLAAADGRPLPTYEPGQFLTLHLPPVDGGKPVVRCYTLSDRPREEFFRVSVKHCPAPASEPSAPPGAGSTILHQHVAVGDVVQAAAPRGDFFLQPVSEEPVVLVGAGIGVTPLISMLAAQFHAGLRREVYLLLGMRNSDEHPFKEPLAELAAARDELHQFVAYSAPLPTDEPMRDFQHYGRIDLSYVKQVLPSRDFQFFLCGPPAMMHAMVPGLLDWGVADDQIHFEAFGPASVNRDGVTTAAKAAVGAEVRFARSKKAGPWSEQDATILELAERLGVPMEAGCRVGNCGACATRVVAGDTVNIKEAGAPCPQGECLACISVPAGPVELDA